MRPAACIMTLPLLLLLSCATVSRDTQKADAHYKLGISNLKAGKVQQAFVELQRAVRLNPRDKRAHNALGLIYEYFEDMEKAEEAFLKAIEIDRGYSEAYNNLGVIYMRMKRWDEAISAFTRAVKNPLYVNPEKAFTNLGKVYYRKGDYQDAIRAYKSAIKRAPEFHAPYYGLALCYNALGRYGDASEALTEAVRFDPFLQGDVEKAEEEFRRRKLKASDPDEERDYAELIEMLRY